MTGRLYARANVGGEAFVGRGQLDDVAHACFQDDVTEAVNAPRTVRLGLDDQGLRQRQCSQHAGAIAEGGGDQVVVDAIPERR